ncbi:TetR family transcriptional regulator [Actinokineospora bangkokensis]|uniref:TetR family transcriptional regulator n=1 Tax=Actinokineospora bangkokensis TaxID=1193682 RepID=A0A1Q9LMW7_9PSEU|nr:TetR family transcriptional regulator [Actinokineospora bangkokensis]
MLDSAMRTFARNGYRATSMDAIARDAKISRPGLYFLFSTKESLFREAVTRTLTEDLTAIEAVLADPATPLADRLLAAFDRWAGRYVGPMAQDIPAVIADNPDLLDEVATSAPDRFATLLHHALAQESPRAHDIAATLTSVSVGLKHQVQTRDTYLDRMRTAIDLLTP